MKKATMMRRVVMMSVFLLLATSLTAMAGQSLMMATTTSTENTGLLDYLSPLFTKATGIELKWVATGTGKALKLGENCDADVLLVHDPDAEKKYVAAGHGIERREIMYNDFVIIGPEADPAGIKGKTAGEALAAVRAKTAIFVSRGDNSGTHSTEKSIWQNAGGALPEKEAWYVQTGQGMLPTITVAAERNGYTLTDRGTYIKYEDTQKGNPPLKILVEGDSALLNQYSVICVSPEKCPSVKIDLARKFSEWMAGAEAQKLINDFKLLGKQLFFANAK
jgi:tungstate transport system substrate-binding protein